MVRKVSLQQQHRSLGFFIFLLSLTPFLAHAKTEIDVKRVAEIARMLPAHAVGLGMPSTNRVAWQKLAAEPVFENWLRAIHKQATEPMPKISDDLFLDFSRTGNRDRWQ